MICTSKHKPKPRHRGPWNFDEPEETIPRNDELILTRTAIVGLLAEYLAGVLDKREQFGLLKSIELPVSQVLHGMGTGQAPKWI